MKRWGQVRGDIRWRDVAEQVFLATEAGAKMRDLGLVPPASAYRPHTIMGKTFDPADPDGYVASFPLRRA